MSDQAAAANPEAPLPVMLSEVDRLKMQLAKEKQARLQADAINLQMAQRQMQATMQASQAEAQVLFAALKDTYKLAPGDEVGEDGAIKRAPKPPAQLKPVPPPPEDVPQSA